MERPVIFNSENVRAILEGRKTQTRRVVKFQLPDSHRVYKYVYPHPNGGFSFQDFPSLSGISNVIDKTGKMCPYGQVGGKLWVRETWLKRADGGVEYRATSQGYVALDGWRPSIFMPRWASRITLEITEIRVKRLQEITEEDAIKEGCQLIARTIQPFELKPTPHFTAPERPFTHRDHFIGLWDSLNEKRGYGWETNPWVWVISFKLVPLMGERKEKRDGAELEQLN